jgi:hypothetical protein
MMWTEEDRQKPSEKQLSESRRVEIVAPATLQKGIYALTEEEREACIKIWEAYRAKNRTDADVVFIGNSDLVVPDSLQAPTEPYRKALAGLLVDLQEKIFGYLRLIESGSYTHEQVEEMIYFLQNRLCIKNPEMKYLEDVELILYIRQKLLRPLRVCGMVRSAGEPVCGPFLVKSAEDGVVSLQIVESSQIDPTNPQQKALFEQNACFRPVDMVCALKGPDGQKYHLPDFADKVKTPGLPGLWNGAMSDWNTVFVEVPHRRGS